MRNTTTLVLALVFSMLFVVANDAWAVPITGGTGPGGVGLTDGSSSLRLWLRGDVGVSVSGSDVTQWIDQSGNGSIIDPDAVANRPTYTGTQNGVPVLSFNPGNPGAGTAQFLRADSFLMGGTGTATSYAAYKQNVGSIAAADQNGQPFFARAPSTFGLHGNNNSPTTVSAFSAPGGVLATINGTASGSFVEGTWGTIQGTHATVDLVTPYTDLTFGFDIGARLLIGDIGEVVIYNDSLSSVEQIMVQNYINSKFDTPLAAAVNKYSGDDGVNGDYDYDVFGIGNDGPSSVTNSGSAGFGLEATGGTLNSGEFVLAGHKTTNNGLTSADMSANDQRWERVWYLDTNGGDVDATLGFGWSDSGLVSAFDASFGTLYYNPTDPFSFTAIASASSVVGDQVFFDLTSLPTGFYTIGTAVPEPSSLVLMGLGALGLVRHTRRRRRRA